MATVMRVKSEVAGRNLFSKFQQKTLFNFAAMSGAHERLPNLHVSRNTMRLRGNIKVDGAHATGHLTFTKDTQTKSTSTFLASKSTHGVTYLSGPFFTQSSMDDNDGIVNRRMESIYFDQRTSSDMKNSNENPKPNRLLSRTKTKKKKSNKISTICAQIQSRSGATLGQSNMRLSVAGILSTVDQIKEMRIRHN